MSTKKELVRKAFHNEKTERIPVGFWHHFVAAENFNAALQNPEIIEQNLAGTKKYKEAFDPDFVKVMTDGLFTIPYDFSDIHSAADLKKLQPIAEDHPWIEASVKLAKSVREIYGDDILIFFNIFSPLVQLRNGYRKTVGLDPRKDPINELLKEDASAVAEALNLIANDLTKLIKKVIGAGLADGIYLSVSNGKKISEADYTSYVKPSELAVLAAANEVAEDNILHICGYAGQQNFLSVYQDYTASVINWAVFADGLSLKEGKEFFGGKAVIGGFDQTTESILYKGSKEEIEKAIDGILSDAGDVGVILGADCTIPADTPIEHIKWVREKVASL